MNDFSYFLEVEQLGTSSSSARFERRDCIYCLLDYYLTVNMLSWLDCLTQEPFLLGTDASNVGIGTALSQVHSDNQRVIVYYSHGLSKPECNYCTTMPQLLAVVRTIESFHCLLYERWFTVRTDHASLQWLLSFKSPEGQMERWLEKLQTYDFCVVYRGREKSPECKCVAKTTLL